MAKNKMGQVAAMFGKQLGKVGLERLTKYNAWEQINCFIPSLLTGELEIMEG
jgi:hypothetical protein